MISYGIVIPIWNQSDLTVQCLRSIREHTKDYLLILINNGSEKKEWETIQKEVDRHEHWIAIHNKRNLGFVKATNQGLRLAQTPYIVLMNNDTEAVEGWAEKLREPLDEHPMVGLVGGRTTTKDSWQGLAEGGKGYRVLDPGHMLAFFCTMIRKNVIERVGYLDERFGVGFADDDFYCWMAEQHGFRLALRKDLVIPHHHRSTFKELYTEEEIKAMQDKNMKLFLKAKEEYDKRT